MKHAFALSALALGLVLGSVGAARADVPPPNATQCNGKNPGDACTDDTGNRAVCKESTCSRLVNGGGGPPTSVSTTCTLCIATDGASTSTGSSRSCGRGCSTEPAAAGSAYWLAGAFAMLLLRRRK
jgi:MYXO-CTERM domain-containing protein